MKSVYSFDDDRREILIDDPKLPQPWINYLSNGTFHAFVSQAGGGFAWWKSPLKYRLSRYRQYNLPIDSPGFYISIRGADGVPWSPTWRPHETALDKWQAAHSPGLTRFTAQKGNILAVLELFIAPDTDVLVWDLQLKNLGHEPVQLDVFGFVEFSLLEWKTDTDWACYMKHHLNVEFDAKANAIVYIYRSFDLNLNHNAAGSPLVYFGSSEPVFSCDCDRDVFVGNYRDERNPVAVEKGACSNSKNLCGDPCGALHHRPEIPAGGSCRFQFFLGAEEQAMVQWPRALEAVRSSMARLRNVEEIDRLKSGVQAWWHEHLGILQTKLPDADIARQINTWNPVQSVHTGRYSRSISQHASGVRTMGFRDTCQDMLAVAYRKPQWAAEILRYLVSQQYTDGHVPHQCNPVEGAPAEPRIHIDNPLWLPMLAHAILSETGEFNLLNERLPWLNSQDNLSPVGSATIWEHLLRIPDFMENNLGKHGIPLTKRGDWNDIIGKFSRAGRGESIMAAQQYVYVLRLLSDIAGVQGDAASVERLDALREKQQEAIQACAWDGQWWRRGYDDDGNPIGSEACQFGKIWLNSQTWSVIAASGSLEQNLQAMNSVAAILDTNLCGIKKIHPGFLPFPNHPDPFSGYSVGCGENGSIFCHANTWAIIAEAMLGRPEKAWHYYRQLVPHLASQRLGLQRYKAEPYAYVSNIVGPENPKYGWANVTQVTGAAAWMDIAATQYLLGIRPELRGLRLAPCLPADWNGFSAVRQFRGCRLEIQVQREDAPIRIVVNNKALEDNLVPADLLVGNKTLQVKVFGNIAAEAFSGKSVCVVK
jgi:cellobiose phosphorylase